jgi:heat shock protein HslJ
VSPNRFLRTGVAALLAVAVAALSACGTTSSPGGSTPSGATPTPSSPALVGTSWVLSGYAAPGGNIRPVAAAAAPATLVFGADGSLSGSTGCNGLTGSYTQSGSALTVESVGTTQRACTPASVMAQEQAVLEGLSAVRSFSVAGTALTLRDGAGAVVLTYSAGTSDLAGTSWRATGINNGAGAVQTSTDTARVTAVFGRNGTLSGNGGCNSYSATWATSGDAGLTLGPISSTTMACEAMTTEGQYFTALGAVTSYRIEGDGLTLRDATGATQITYTRVRG